MKKLQQGFTLIELMIVVAIIGILAAIAIPAYQNYTIRAQVTEGLNLADGVKTAVGEYYADHGKWPADLTAVGMDATKAVSGKYVTSVVIATGTINAKYGGTLVNQNVKGDLLSLRPSVSDNGDVIWVCGKATTPGNASDPASGAASADATTVPGKYLPSACR